MTWGRGGDPSVYAVIFGVVDFRPVPDPVSAFNRPSTETNALGLKSFRPLVDFAALNHAEWSKIHHSKRFQGTEGTDGWAGENRVR
jgi:hypothetical protein